MIIYTNIYGGDLRLRFIVYKIKRWDLQISKLTRTGFIELSADALRFTTESGLANTESDFRDKETRYGLLSIEIGFREILKN